MKKLLLLCAVLLVPISAPALENPMADPQDRGFPPGYHKAAPGPPAGEEIRKYADDPGSPPQENFNIPPIHDNEFFAVFHGDRLEYQSREGKEQLLWDVQGWIGSDYNKLYFKSEGTYLFDEEKAEEIETELLYSRTIAPFWDIQAGIRYDFRPEPTRGFAAFGVQGLAPYWFETQATAYVSEDGDLSAALEFEYDLLLSQRLILQPRFETSIAVQEVKEYGVGRGINDIVLGLRLRYEIRREFAPYIGISWSQKIGKTADLAEADGEDTSITSFVAGVKVWF